MPHFGGSMRVAGVALGVSALMGVVGAAAAGAEVFDDTGAAQEYTVPPDVCEVTVDAYGAQGGSAPLFEQEGTNPGGAGGRLQARVQVTPGERLGVYVGQQGVPGSGQNNDPGGAGGFNGGGAGGAGENGHPGAGGGGASGVRQQPGGSGCPPCAAPTPPHGPGSTLDERVVVAGGGGGAGGQDESGAGAGGAGGGESGGTPDGDGQVSDEGLDGGTAGADGGAGGGNGQPGGAGAPGQGGFGGTDTSSATTSGAGGGGGGGFQGGGGGSGPMGESDSGGAGGGGGSNGAAPEATVLTDEAGVHAGDGRVIITPSGARLLPCPTPLVIVATPRFTG